MKETTMHFQDLPADLKQWFPSKGDPLFLYKFSAYSELIFCSGSLHTEQPSPSLDIGWHSPNVMTSDLRHEGMSVLESKVKQLWTILFPQIAAQFAQKIFVRRPIPETWSAVEEEFQKLLKLDFQVLEKGAKVSVSLHQSSLQSLFARLLIQYGYEYQGWSRMWRRWLGMSTLQQVPQESLDNIRQSCQPTMAQLSASILVSLGKDFDLSHLLLPAADASSTIAVEI